MPDDLTPVYLSERLGHVSVLKLLGTGEKLAIYEGDRWEEIGQVLEVTIRDKYESGSRKGQGRTRQMWQWHWDEQEYGRATGNEINKKRAVAALLAMGGYRLADENATIPDLFQLE